MDVREGYKQTLVGAIPIDWTTDRLSNIASIATGNTPPTRDRSNYGDEFLFVSPADISDNKFVTTTEKMLSRKGFALARHFPKDSILFVCIGSTIGKSALAGTTLTSNQQINAVLPSDHTHPHFLHYALKRVSRGIKRSAGEQAVPIVNKTRFGETIIPLPPTLAEQQAIAEALSDADALIESLEQLIAKKRQIKQGAMQELLTGKRRLPGFEGEWDSLPLGDCCQITTGQKDVNAGNPEGEFPFFTCSRHHTFSDNYSFDTAAILVAGNGEVGNLHRYIGKFEAYQRTYVLHDFSLELPYIWYQLEAFLAPSLGLGKIGSSIPYIKRENLTTFALRFPLTREERGAIAEVLSNIDAEIELLTVKLSKARLLKQGMMQELLTGRIRLV